jgi:hypothetical protein
MMEETPQLKVSQSAAYETEWVEEISGSSMMAGALVTLVFRRSRVSHASSTSYLGVVDVTMMFQGRAGQIHKTLCEK